MKKEFLSNIFLILGINLLIKPFYVFGIEAEVQNIVGTQTYGLYFALFNLCFLFQFFLDLGIQNYTSRYISEDRKRYQNYFAKTLGTKLILSLVFVSLSFISFYVLAYDPAHFKLMSLVAIQMVLISFLMFIRANISALGHFRADSLLSVLDKLLLLISLAYVLYFSTLKNAFSIEQFVCFQIAATSITFLVAFIFLQTKKRNIKIGFSFDYSRKLIKKTMPFALVFLIMTLYTKMDGVMLSRLLDDNNQQAGIYAAAYRIIDALLTVGFLFSALLLPMFAYITTLKERNELWEVAYKLLLNVALIGTMVGLVYRQEILEWLYVDADHYYSDVFIGLILSFGMMTIAFLFGIMLTAKGNLMRLNIIYFIGVVINWSLNLFLIPKHMAEGAAYATLVTQTFVLIGLIYLSYRDLAFSVSYKLLLKTLLFILISAVCFYAIKVFFPANWVIGLSFSVLLTILVSFLLGFLRFDLVNQLIKTEEV